MGAGSVDRDLEGAPPPIWGPLSGLREEAGPGMDRQGSHPLQTLIKARGWARSREVGRKAGALGKVDPSW